MLYGKVILFLIIGALSIQCFGQQLIPDPSFGSSGKRITRIGPGRSRDTGKKSVISADGSIFVTGQFEQEESVYGSYIAKYTTNGELDKAFADNGIMRSADSVYYGNGGVAIALQSDGKIIVASKAEKGFALRRYDEQGDLDSSFGLNGVVLRGSSESEYPWQLAVLPDNKILISANLIKSGKHTFSLFRFLSNGQQDNSFGSTGVVSLNLSGNDEYPYSMTLQADEKIILAGGVLQSNGFSKCQLVRYHSSGAIDQSFGVNGMVQTEVGPFGTGYYLDLAIDDQDRIVAVGEATGGSDIRNLCARYLTDGSLDNSFANEGLDVRKITAGTNGLNCVQLVADGKIVVGGGFGAASPDFTSYFAIMRFTKEGQLDTSLNSTGYLLLNTGNYETNYCYDISLQTDNKLVFVGNSNSPDDGGDLTVLRYMNDPSGLEELGAYCTHAYPNPTTGLVYFKNLPVGTTTEVFDANGRLLEKLDNVDKADLSNFTPGIYLFRFTNDKTVYTSKVMLSY